MIMQKTTAWLVDTHSVPLISPTKPCLSNYHAVMLELHLLVWLDQNLTSWLVSKLKNGPFSSRAWLGLAWSFWIGFCVLHNALEWISRFAFGMVLVQCYVTMMVGWPIFGFYQGKWKYFIFHAPMCWNHLLLSWVVRFNHLLLSTASVTHCLLKMFRTFFNFHFELHNNNNCKLIIKSNFIFLIKKKIQWHHKSWSIFKYFNIWVIIELIFIY